MKAPHPIPPLLLALALVLLGTGLAGCDEDEKVKTQPEPPGSGSVGDPFVLGASHIYSDLTIAPGQKVYFRIDGLDSQAIYSVFVASANDEEIDLALSYNDSTYGLAACRPGLVGGHESCWFVTDNQMATAFGFVDGALLTAPATFTLTVALGFQTSGSPAPGASEDFWGYAPGGTTLVGALQAPTENFSFAVWDSAAAPVSFVGNVLAGRCDVNNAPAGPVESCTVPLGGVPGYRFTVTNNGAAAEAYTLILNVF